MKTKNKSKSTGELISSVAFFGFSLWLFFEARSQIGFASDLRIWGLYLAAAVCFLAAFRFAIADVIRSFLQALRK